MTPDRSALHMVSRGVRDWVGALFSKICLALHHGLAALLTAHPYTFAKRSLLGTCPGMQDLTDPVTLVDTGSQTLRRQSAPHDEIGMPNPCDPLRIAYVVAGANLRQKTLQKRGSQTEDEGVRQADRHLGSCQFDGAWPKIRAALLGLTTAVWAFELLKATAKDRPTARPHLMGIGA